MTTEGHELIELRRDATGGRRRLDRCCGLLLVGDHDCAVFRVTETEALRLAREERADAEVIVLRDVIARQLAAELGVSIGFVDLCTRAGVPVAQGKAVLAWFLRQERADRIAIIKAVLTSERRANRRGGRS